MLTAIIIDDEEMGRIALREKIVSYCPHIKLIGEAENGLKGLKLIKEMEPQLVFLDIEMPGMNGFEMLNQILDQQFHLVFITAYDQYAIKAIRYAAFDYLLKPVDIEELIATVTRVQKNAKENTQQKLEILQQNLKTELRKIAIPTMEGLSFINIMEIVRLEAAGNYTMIYLVNKSKIITGRTLKDFEELLPKHLFFRSHHSHLINLNHIKKYIKGDGGQIEMDNGDYVSVSRRKKEEFLKRISQL